MSGLDTLVARCQQSSKCAIWGGSSKGIIAAIYLHRAGVDVECLIDINPAKQGKFAAVTGLPILGPDEAIKCLPEGAAMLVMNSNYLEEIKQMSNNRYRYLGVD